MKHHNSNKHEMNPYKPLKKTQELENIIKKHILASQQRMLNDKTLLHFLSLIVTNLSLSELI